MMLEETLNSVSSSRSPHSVANPVLTESLLSVDASTVCSTVSETEAETETGLAVMPLNVHIPDDAVLLNWPVLGNLKVITGEWTAKKVLTKSDCDNQHRLLIGREEAQKNILNFLDEARMEKVYSKDGLRLNVFDCDTGSWVEQTLKRWVSSKGIGLMENWKRDFVVRRGLKVGDEVGLCWDDQHENMLFSVLRRS